MRNSLELCESEILFGFRRPCGTHHWCCALLMGVLVLWEQTQSVAVAQQLNAPNRTTPRDSFFSGPRFERQLDTSVVGWSWSRQEFRAVMRSIAREQHLAILLDRRINPNRLFDGDFSGPRMRDVLQQIASKVQAEIRFVGSTVYVGPPRTCARLRTAVQLLYEQLDAISQPDNLKRRNQFMKRSDVVWDDLQEPRLLVQSIADRYDLKITNLDAVPHDLWAAATLPKTNAVESLLLVLGQYDLWFRWHPAGNAIEIMSLPESLLIQKKYTVSRSLSDETAARWKRELPGIVVERSGQQTLLVKATWEQHELIATRKALAKRPGQTVKPQSPVVPISRRTFTLTIKDVPASALIKKLEMSGIEFRFDARMLKSAGIDFNQKIQMRVNMADGDAFFHAMFDQMQIRFEIEGVQVRLRPQ